MKARLGAMAEKFEIIGDVRGRGAMIAIELVKEGRGGGAVRARGRCGRRGCGQCCGTGRRGQHGTTGDTHADPSNCGAWERS
ncbi:hypothetical protein, partial [Streptomyces sp. NPDC004830]